MYIYRLYNFGKCEASIDKKGSHFVNRDYFTMTTYVTSKKWLRTKIIDTGRISKTVGLHSLTLSLSLSLSLYIYIYI